MKKFKSIALCMGILISFSALSFPSLAAEYIPLLIILNPLFPMAQMGNWKSMLQERLVKTDISI